MRGRMTSDETAEPRPTQAASLLAAILLAVVTSVHRFHEETLNDVRLVTIFVLRDLIDPIEHDRINADVNDFGGCLARHRHTVTQVWMAVSSCYFEWAIRGILRPPCAGRAKN